MSLFFTAETRAISEVPWGHGGDSPASVTQGVAMSVVPMYAAVKLISDSISTMPLHGYTKRSDGTRTRTPLPRSMSAPTGSSGTTVEWVQRGIVSMLMQGAACGILSGDDRGYPGSCSWVSPSQITYVDGAWYWQGRRLERGQLLYIPAVVVPGQAEGISVVRSFATTLDAASEAQKASRQWAKNRAVPGVHVRNTAKTLTPTEAEAVKERSKATIRNGEPYVSGKDWEIDFMSVPPGDAAFLQSIGANATQIATMFNLPPESIGGTTGGSLTYNTVEQQAIQILTFGLRPWMVKFETAVSAALMPRPQYVKFSADALIRVDTKARHETYEIDRRIGLRSIDEIRELEDLPPLPDGQGETFAPLAVATAAPSSRENPR